MPAASAGRRSSTKGLKRFALSSSGSSVARGLPEALFHPVAVQQHQACDAHRGHRLQHPAQHLGAGQGQQQGERQLGRRWLVKDNGQAGLAGVEGLDLAGTHQAIQQADAHPVAGSRLVDLAQMGETARIAQHDPVSGREVGRFEQDQIHGRSAGGWASAAASSSASGRSRFCTKRPNSRPISNSSHMGTASMVWEKTSGGVRIMPTTKQPMMT